MSVHSLTDAKDVKPLEDDAPVKVQYEGNTPVSVTLKVKADDRVKPKMAEIMHIIRSSNEDSDQSFESSLEKSSRATRMLAELSPWEVALYLTHNDDDRREFELNIKRSEDYLKEKRKALGV